MYILHSKNKVEIISPNTINQSVLAIFPMQEINISISFRVSSGLKEVKYIVFLDRFMFGHERLRQITNKPVSRTCSLCLRKDYGKSHTAQMTTNRRVHDISHISLDLQ
jgi:hypothetical protein